MARSLSLSFQSGKGCSVGMLCFLLEGAYAVYILRKRYALVLEKPVIAGRAVYNQSTKHILQELGVGKSIP